MSKLYNERVAKFKRERKQFIDSLTDDELIAFVRNEAY